MRILVVGPSAVARHNGGGERFRLTVEALKRVGLVEILLIGDASVDPALESECGCAVRAVRAQFRRLSSGDYIRLLGGRGLPRRLRRHDFELQRQVVQDVVGTRFDLVWLYGDVAGLTIDGDLGHPVVLDLVDYEAQRDFEVARASKPWYDLVEAVIARADRTALRRCITSLSRAAAIAVISSRVDAQSIDGDVRVVPNGYRARGATLRSRFPTADEKITYLFVGTMGYRPNRDAAIWLAKDIWPRMLAVQPHAQLRIVGRNPPDELNGTQNVVATGEVDDIQHELDRADVALVPVRLGSGTRVKILEAWANGLPVITTQKGAEGLPVVGEVNVVLADTPTDFAIAADRLVREPTLVDGLRRNGRALYEAQFSSHVIIDAFEAVARDALVANPSGGRLK